MPAAITSKYSRRLAVRSAMVSPAFTPAARSAWIRRLVRSSRARQVVVPVSSTSAGSSGRRAAMSAKSRAISRSYRVRLAGCNGSGEPALECFDPTRERGQSAGISRPAGEYGARQAVDALAELGEVAVDPVVLRLHHAHE